MHFDLLPPSSAEGHSSTAVESHDEHERNVSSSDSSKPDVVITDMKNGKNGNSNGIASKKLPLSTSAGSNNTLSTTLTVAQERGNPTGRSNDMRPLSPIKPLSPIGL